MPALDFSDLPDRPSRTPHKSLKWILGVCASITVVALSSTLASNINLNGGGFADWFIPSRDEMYLISNSTQFSHGGFNQDSYYWSSTANSEGPGTGVQLHFMNNSDGTQDPGLQPVYRNFPVRPIRAF